MELKPACPPLTNFRFNITDQTFHTASPTITHPPITLKNIPTHLLAMFIKGNKLLTNEQLDYSLT